MYMFSFVHLRKNWGGGVALIMSLYIYQKYQSILTRLLVLLRNEYFLIKKIQSKLDFCQNKDQLHKIQDILFKK